MEGGWLEKARAAVEQEAAFYATHSFSTTDTDSLWLSRAKQLAAEACDHWYPTAPTAEQVRVACNTFATTETSSVAAQRIQQQQAQQLQLMKSEIEALQQQQQISIAEEKDVSTSSTVGAFQNTYLRLMDAVAQKQFYEMVQVAEEGSTSSSSLISEMDSILGKRETKLRKEKRKLELLRDQLTSQMKHTRDLLDQGVAVVVRNS